jgi:hypothetical protein
MKLYGMKWQIIRDKLFPERTVSVVQNKYYSIKKYNPALVKLGE